MEKKGADIAITTVLLDAGGVILDESEHEKVRSEIIAEVLSPLIPRYSISTYHSDIDEAIECFCPRTYEYVFWKHFKDNKSLFDELYKSYLNSWQEHKPPLKLSFGIEKEIEEICRNFKIGIAGQYGKELIDFLERKCLLDYFTCYLTQDDFSITKPDPRYFEQLARALGITPQEGIMVGDRVDNDIIPAKQLGMKTILIRAGLHKNQQPRIPFEVPDMELQGLVGLSDAIKKLAFSQAI
jgi:HAD superfamily hydrolase (TIGR01549 family)